MSPSSRQAKPIGVFDSGIGGLTVVRAIMRLLPHENIVYFGDTARVPYGPKSPQVVKEYAAEDTEFLVRHNIKMVVVACNTVSAVALDVVQKHSRVPVLGVIVPGADAAVKATKNKRIGIIGTLGTIASNAYTNAIRSADATAMVYGQACPLFVPLAEEGWIDHRATEMIAAEYLFPLKSQKIDTLVLGCTHYPILEPVIRKYLGDGVSLIDSGNATAAEIAHVLDREELRNPSKVKANVQFFVSDIPLKFTEVGERFLGQKLGRVRLAGGGRIMALLKNDEIQRELKTVPAWELVGKEIRRKVVLKDFLAAMSFVTAVAVLAEKQNHHPDIDIRWNTVTLTLSTHSAGGLTDKDFLLARAIDAV